MLKKIISISFIIFVILGCTKSFTDLEEFEEFLNSDESSFITKIEKGDFIFTLKYMPTDAMMISSYKDFKDKIDVMKKDSINFNQKKETFKNLKQGIDEEKKIYDQSLYFHLTIKHKDGKDIVYDHLSWGQQDYTKWLNQLTFGLKDHLFLYTEKSSKVPMSLYQMDRTYGMMKSRSFILVFPHTFNKVSLRTERDLSFVIKEFGFHLGIIKFDKLNLNKKINFKLGDVNDTIL